MSPKSLASLQDQRLHRQFRYQLYAFAPFYRRKYGELNLEPDAISKLADLPKAPLVTRAMLAAGPSEFFLRPTRALIQKYGAASQLFSVSVEMILHGSQRSEQLVRHEYEPVHHLATSGTQGDPITISLSRRDLANLAVQGERMLSVAGVGPGDKIVNLLANQPSGGFWPAWLGGVSMEIEQWAPWPIEPDKASDVVESRRPSVVIGEAAFLLRMFQAARRVPPDLKTVILAPKVAPPALRKQLEDAVGSNVKILATYGFAEGRTVWVECAEGAGESGFHTYPDHELFEVLNPETESPADPNRGGEIVFTSLTQRGTALARYRPGDLVSAIKGGPCPHCGRNVDRIIGPVKRIGKLVTVHALGSAPIEIDKEILSRALQHPDLASWQLEITKMPGESNGFDDLCLLFMPQKNKDPATLAVEIDAILRQEIGLSPQLVLSDRTGGGVLDLR